MVTSHFRGVPANPAVASARCEFVQCHLMRRTSLIAAALAVATTVVPATIASTATTAATAGATTRAATSPRVAVPTVIGPITAPGAPFDVAADLSQLPTYGYVQEEFFISGTATAYAPTKPLESSGRWSVAPTTTAPYTTRLLVRRPADPARANGTVVVEWLNVTAGFDTSPDWGYNRAALMREGFTWVGVSAQFVGVEGPPGGFGIGGLKATDPARYGTLSHPGDDYSYDIYSQAGAVLRRPGAVDALAGIRADQLVADGESQSASRMTTYINAVQPLANVYDGFIVHSRSRSAAPLQLGVAQPSPVFVRTDQRAPVLVIEAETDVPGHFAARQPDGPTYRLWEIAGTAHVDLYMLGPAAVGVLGCALPVNAGPQHYVMQAGLAYMRRWIRTPSLAPPRAPRLAPDGTGVPLRDAYGNALGGIRTPQLDVPVATLSGSGNSGNLFCSLAGTTTPFTDAQLIATYTRRDEYLKRYVRATKRALDNGFILRSDVVPVLVEALLVPFPATP